MQSFSLWTKQTFSHTVRTHEKYFVKSTHTMKSRFHEIIVQNAQRGKILKKAICIFSSNQLFTEEVAKDLISRKI